ncbi:MAG TPA: response regulator [Candidatus Dormibacteraeota bacterium]|nr:response regulator [Candidatus Dormibacteraeota bacterium]
MLLADDDPDIRELGRLLLARHGHQVVTAEDGVEAIAMLPRETPALVVTDLNMPRKDGRDVCSAVRSSSILHSIPVVMLTAMPPNDERVVQATTECRAVVLLKTDISTLGELADRLVANGSAT